MIRTIVIWCNSWIITEKNHYHCNDPSLQEGASRTQVVCDNLYKRGISGKIPAVCHCLLHYFRDKGQILS